jgi:serine/threonine protein kinase
MWKITDFGFTSEGVSTAKTTLYGRGTSGYRAPELLGLASERPRFSNRSDIWALGCVFHEIVAGDRLFGDDFATFQYKIASESEPPLKYLYGNGLWDDLFSDWARHVLSKDASSRPNAEQACRFLSTYAHLLAKRMSELNDYIFCLNNSQELRRLGTAFLETGRPRVGTIIYQMLRENGPQGTVQLSLNRAVERGDLFSFIALVELGEDVEGLWDQTPLQWPRRTVREKIVHCLRDANYQDRAGRIFLANRAYGIDGDTLECPKVVVLDQDIL